MEERLASTSTKVMFSNPLLNPGRHCAGGYSNELGCNNQYDLPAEHNYDANLQMVEKLYKSALIRPEDLSGFSIAKLKQFLRRNHRFADKHRAISYKYILNLPSDIRAFKALENAGSHSCTRFLHLKYPIKNPKLLQALKTTLDLLANYCPMFAEADCVAVLAFPVVSVFGQDLLLTFEVMQRLLTHYLGFVFERFPLAHPDVLRNIELILGNYDPNLLAKLRTERPGLLTKISWSLITTYFSDVFSREHYLSLLDQMLLEKEKPIILQQVAAFVITHRATILALDTKSKEDDFLDTQKNIHLPKYLQLVKELVAKYSANVDFDYSAYSWKNGHSYSEFTRYPKEALQMYRSKRLLADKDLEYQVQAENFRNDIANNLEKVIKQEQIDAHNQQKLQEALKFRYEAEQRQNLNVKRTDEKERIARLKHYIQLLDQNIQSQETLAQTALDLPLRRDRPTEEELTSKTTKQLDVLENKLIKMLMNRPQPTVFTGAVVHPILGTVESRDGQGLQNHMNAEILQRVRQVGELQRKNQEQKWELEMQKVYKRV